MVLTRSSRKPRDSSSRSFSSTPPKLRSEGDKECVKILHINSYDDERENDGREGEIGNRTSLDDEESGSEDDENEPSGKKEPAPSKGADRIITTKKKGDRKSKTDDSKHKNELTKLIPGYTASFRLDSSCLLDQYTPKGGIAELRRKAQRTDKSTAAFVVHSSGSDSNATKMNRTSNGFLPAAYSSTALYSSFKTGHRKPVIDITAGKGWFGMVPNAMTDELKTDLAVLKNRSYLDPKRFYKKTDTLKGKILQVGTVIEGSAEFYSSRLTNKERRQNLAEEIMADPHSADYTKRKYKKMQQAKSEAGNKRSRNRMNKKGRKGF